MIAMARPLDEYRREKYLTVIEFAELLGIAVQTLYSITRDKKQPRVTTMRRIAEKLEVHPSDITEFVHKASEE